MPYQRLFDTQRSDPSVWTGKPFGLHSFGHQQLFPVRQTVDQSVDLVDTSDTKHIDQNVRRAPSFCHCTVRGAIADVLNLWVQGDGLARGDFVRTASQWFPSHLRGVWQGGPIEIAMELVVLEHHRAIIRAKVRNTGSTPFRGTLCVQGDENHVNAKAAWWRLHGAGRCAGEGAAVVEKTIGMGLGPDIFPYFKLLAEDQQVFDWTYAYYRLAFALDGQGWQGKNIAIGEDHQTWLQTRDVELAPGEHLDVTIGFCGQWCGRVKPTPTDLGALVETARRVTALNFEQQREAAQSFWKSFFARVPVPSAKWSSQTVDLYYKAWCCIYYNVWPATDTMLHHCPHPTINCAKVTAATFIAPATWEVSFAAILLSLVEPTLATQLIESLYDATEEDGFLAEAPGNRRNTQLACIEPLIAWQAYKASGDLAFLKRIFPNLLRNLRYRLHFPNWRHLTAASCRNYAYGLISSMYALRIARQIGASHQTIQTVQTWVNDAFRAVDAYWDTRGGFYRSYLDPNGPRFATGTGAEALVPLFPGCHRDAYRPRLVQLIREHFMTPQNTIARVPHDLPFSDTFPIGPNTESFTLKEGNLLAVLYGLKQADRDVFEKVVQGTVANIAKANDFYEGYTIDGVGRHNGPGTIFGAFGVIYSMLLSDDRVDHFFD